MKKTLCALLVAFFLLPISYCLAGGMAGELLSYVRVEYGLSEQEFVNVVRDVGRRDARQEVLPAGTELIILQTDGRLVSRKTSINLNGRVYRRASLAVLYNGELPWAIALVKSAKSNVSLTADEALLRLEAVEKGKASMPSISSPINGRKTMESFALPSPHNDTVIEKDGQPQILVASADDAELITRPSEEAAKEAAKKAEITEKVVKAHKGQRTKMAVNAGIGLSAVGAAFISGWGPYAAAGLAALGIVYNIFTFDPPEIQAE